MFKILRLPAVSKPVSMVLIFSFLIMISGCYYFKVTRPTGNTSDVVTRVNEEQKFIILHLEDKAWQMTNIKVSQDTVSGSISPLIGHDRYKTVKPESSNRYQKNKVYNGSDILNEVHIYISEFLKTSNGRIAFPTDAVNKIEIYEKDSGATVASWVFGSLGAAAGAFAVFLVILALTKSSCPFVYAYDGNDYMFSGEIFSGATQPGLERDDYFPVPAIASNEGTYDLRLTNEVHEIQSINLAKLLIVDHPKGVSTLVDKSGRIQTFKTPVNPVAAENSTGENILPLLEKKDSLYYSGDMTGSGKNGIEGVVLKFLKPEDSKTAKLLIRAKNSFWLDVLFTRFHSLFGDRYEDFSKKQESASTKKLNKFLLEQNIPLSVYVEKDGKWRFADYFNIAGPMAMRNDILPIDLSGIRSDTVRIKLETGFLFWEIDYAAIDFTRNDFTASDEQPVLIATDNHGSDIKELLGSKDKNYLVLKEIGDEALLKFNDPIKQDEGRSVFLHTSGYYKILRDQTGPPDIGALKTFKRPNRFPEFSREMYMLLTEKN